ncbi:phosphopantetheine-binding protein [Micromonospora okii]|uniref:phosphopantetheine-binding protein n=1 Tax=Micromonospora okii TaxID=1182970 RepID=UPI001E50D091|nr:phosphopantetheine-binding protein [Micromonospora okii]
MIIESPVDTPSVPWHPRYEQVLREHLPDAAATLRGSDSLFDLGLDSFDMVELLVALEAAFGVIFPDETLTADTFATVGSLWAALAELLPTPPDGLADNSPPRADDRSGGR